MKQDATHKSFISNGRAAHTLASFIMHALLLLAVLHVTHCGLKAQTSGAVEARVGSVRGRAVVTGNGRTTASDLSRGDVLSPGDEIDTRGGARVTIELSDGSVVIIQPNSIVVLQDYRNASSLRELLRIMMGRVRVRINHYGGRPNPYRINSPTASIAVRGTEFSVSVEARGDTEVVVFEGLVEVASLTNPAHPVMVEAGHGVIVRPNDDIRFFVPGPTNEIGERTSQGRARTEESDDDSDSAVNDRVADGHRRDVSLRTAAGVYERYFESIVESGETPLPARFAAFPDSYFDSVENPAYATEFKATEGRAFLLPSIGGTGENENAREIFGFNDPRQLDYSFSPQVSLFVPLPKYRAVVGGRIAFSRDGFQSFTLQDDTRLTGSLFQRGTRGRRTVEGWTTNGLFTLSLMAARRFGSDGRTSLGIGLDYLSTRGSLSSTWTQSDAAGVTALERVESGSIVDRTRFTIGLTRTLSGGQKFGIFYRYGFTSAEDRDRSRTLNDAPRPLEMTRATSRSSEIGLRLRGAITRRLFYGAEGSYFLADNDERTKRLRVVGSNIAARSTRTTLGFGLGYLFRPRTVFSFDAAAGVARISDVRLEDATGNLLEDEKRRAFFVSLHGALQADVWRNLFVSGSVLSVTQSRVIDLALYPDRYGRRLTNQGLFEPDGRTGDRFTDYFSNLGIGWRFTPGFLAEYIFSTDFGQTSPRHTLLLRYTFGRGER